jgi:hypothetical protein
MKKLLLALSLLAFGAVVASAAPSWTYVQGDYAYQQGVAPHSGLNLQGSWQIGSNFYAVGSSTEFLGSSRHANRTSLGAGAFLPINSKVDAYVQLQGVAQTSNTPSSTTAWGEAGQVGLRADVLPSTELFGGVEYQHLNHPVLATERNEVFGVVGVTYTVVHNLAVVGEYKASGQTKEAFGGLRYSF